MKMLSFSLNSFSLWWMFVGGIWLWGVIGATRILNFIAIPSSYRRNARFNHPHTGFYCRTQNSAVSCWLEEPWRDVSKLRDVIGCHFYLIRTYMILDGWTIAFDITFSWYASMQYLDYPLTNCSELGFRATYPGITQQFATLDRSRPYVVFCPNYIFTYLCILHSFGGTSKSSAELRGENAWSNRMR